MASYSGIGGSSDWGNAADREPANSTVGVAIDGSDVAGSLTLSGSTLNADDLLPITGAFNQSAAVVEIASPATISPAGEWTGVGSLSLSLNFAIFPAVGPDAFGPGAPRRSVITVDDELIYDNTVTVSNETIDTGIPMNMFDYIIDVNTEGTGNVTLTFASSVTINVTNYLEMNGGGSGSVTIVNDGTIDQTAGSLEIGSLVFINSGTMDFANQAHYIGNDVRGNVFENDGFVKVNTGGQFTIQSNTFTTTANSVIMLDSNALLYINTQYNWTNIGHISLGIGAELVIYGPTTGGAYNTVVSAASLGLISNSGGTVVVKDTYDNSGLNLNGSNDFGQLFLDGGTIVGGVVTAGGVAFASDRNDETLSGVTYEGPLNLAADEYVSLANGSTVVGAGGSGPGVVNIDGVQSILNFLGTQTVANVTINAGISGYGGLNSSSFTGGPNNLTLTFASSVTIDATNYVNITTNNSNTTIVNQGLIDQISGNLMFYCYEFDNAGTFDINGVATAYSMDDFVNSGKIVIGAGGSLTIRGEVSFANSGSISLAQGAILYLQDSLSAANLGSVSDAGGGIYIEGAFDNSGQVLNGSNPPELTLYGGTISGGVATSAGVTFSNEGGVLSDVTFDGPLNLTDNENVALANGSQVLGANGSGPGVINVNGAYAALTFDDTQTVANVTINVGNSAGASLNLTNPTGGANPVVTFASNVTLDATNFVNIATNAGNETLINQGLIDQISGNLGFYFYEFDNAGTFDINGVATAYSMDDFVNSGKIVIGAGDSLTIRGEVSFANSGSISLAQGAILYLQDSLSTANLGSVSDAGGGIYIEGALDNSGQALNGTNPPELTLWGGTISGGVATSTGVVFTNEGGTLSDVTFEGPLNLTDAENVALANGSQVVGANGSGPGIVNVSGANAILNFDDTQTVANVTINVGNATNWASVNYYDTTGAGSRILTLASSVTINATNYVIISDSNTGNATIVNQGLIDQTSGMLQIYPADFDNAGTIDVGGETSFQNTDLTNSGAINVSSGGQAIIGNGFTNFTSGMLTGGTYTVAANSELQIYNGDTLTTLAARVTLSGTGSQFVVDSIAIDNSLTLIATTGQFELLGGRSWTLDDAVTNDGFIELGGGTIAATASGAFLTNAAGSRLAGYGALDGAFVNSGTIEASGGVLTLANGVTGTGALQIDAKATLVVEGAVTGGAATFNGGNGTLTLMTPGTFGAILGGFSIGDTIFLSGLTANLAKVNASNQLVISEYGTTVTTLALNGAYANFYFLAVAVRGGTDIVSLPTPATLGQYLGYVKDYDLIPGGFSIADTAAKIEANLGSLVDVHLISITLTSGTISVSIATYSRYQTTLDKVVGGFAISDTAAHITSALNALNDAKITSIVISDNGAIAVSVAQWKSDASILAKLFDQNGSAYQLLVTDTAAHISAALNTLNGAHIASITISDNKPISLSIAQLTSDAVAISKLADANAAPVSFAIVDTAAHIGAALNGLNGANIASITISDNAAVGVSVAQLKSDALAVGKLANQNGAAYQLAVIDTAASISRALNTLDGAHIASITISNNSPIILSIAQMSADAVAISKLVDANAAPVTFAVVDTAADITAGLNGLNAANIVSITISNNSPVTVSIAQTASDTVAIGKLVNANKSPGQIAVSDIGANIGAALNNLNGANIASITISDDAAIGVTIAQMTSDAAAIGKLVNADESVGQIAVSDTAAHITAALDNLDGANVASITISDNAAIGVSAAQLTSDAAAISELGNANGAAFQLAVTDTAANISAALDTLDGANVASITLSDNDAVTVSIAQIASDAVAIGKLADANATPYQLAVKDTAVHIAAAAATLEADLAHIASIVSTAGTVTVSAATFLADASALNKIVGGYAISDSLAHIIANLSAFNADADVVSLIGSSGGATLTSVSAIDAASFALSGKGTALTVAESLAYSGAFALGVGSLVSVSAADILTLSGASTIDGAVNGAGEVLLSGGTEAIGGSASFAISAWVSQSETMNVGIALAFGKTFSAGAGDALDMSGGALTLFGKTSLIGGVATSGAFALGLAGATTISGALTIGGTGGVKVSGTVKDSGGNVTLGDSTGATAQLAVAKGGTWDFLDDSNLRLGASASSSIVNAGLIEKTGGTAVTQIAGAIANTGAIEVFGAQLDLLGAITGAGSDVISGATTLDFVSTVASGQTVSFTGKGGALELLNPNAFSGKISDFDMGGASGDSLVLGTPWTYVGFAEAKGNASGTMTLSNGTTTTKVTLLGDYLAANFAHGTNGAGQTVITYA